MQILRGRDDDVKPLRRLIQDFEFKVTNHAVEGPSEGMLGADVGGCTATLFPHRAAGPVKTC